MVIWNKLDKIGKTPIIAKIGGFKPAETEYSTFGGGFYMFSDEEWPQDESGNMIPILQIYVPDIPDGKLLFGETELIQIYLNKNSLPTTYIAPNHDGWLMKKYKTIDGLMLKETPSDVQIYRQFPIRWLLHDKKDFPCWEETWSFVDLGEINESKEMTNKFFDEYDSYQFTKIGGYADYIQSPVSDDYEYIFQISSEEKTRFMVADNGNLYILKSKLEDKWFLHWDCY